MSAFLFLWKTVDPLGTGNDGKFTQVACVSEDLSVEELETLPACTEPRISHHRSPGKRKRFKDERGPSSVRLTLKLFQRQRWGNF